MVIPMNHLRGAAVDMWRSHHHRRRRVFFVKKNLAFFLAKQPWKMVLTFALISHLI